MLRKLAARLPRGAQEEIKRFVFRHQIKRGTFVSPEAEFGTITQFLKPGDTAVDVGANVGHYTLLFSRAVGPAGRVYAFEPMAPTFASLTANMAAAKAYNVSLINYAASDHTGDAWMELPKYDNGNENFYQAAISANGDYRVRCAPLDLFQLSNVVLLKVDAENHDLEVLKGAETLIRRDMPTIMVENGRHGPIADWLVERGYVLSMAEGSPNCVARKTGT